MARDNIVERYSFISLDAYAVVRDEFPHAVSCGRSKILQYAVGALHDEELEQDADVIIRAIEAGLDRAYNCDHSVASVVSEHFNGTKYVPKEIK